MGSITGALFDTISLVRELLRSVLTPFFLFVVLFVLHSFIVLLTALEEVLMDLFCNLGLHSWSNEGSKRSCQNCPEVQFQHWGGGRDGSPYGLPYWESAVARPTKSTLRNAFLAIAFAAAVLGSYWFILGGPVGFP